MSLFPTVPKPGAFKSNAGIAAQPRCGRRNDRNHCRSARCTAVAGFVLVVYLRVFKKTLRKSGRNKHRLVRRDF